MSTSTPRQIRESPVYQGCDEAVPYQVDITPWGADPTEVTVRCLDRALVDISDTALVGSVSVVGNVITTPRVTALQAGQEYRLEIGFTCGNKQLSCYARIIGER